MRAILTYHSLDDSGSPISVAPVDFARHVSWLARARVPVVPLDALLAHRGAGVAITFDDAYTNVASIAAPLLREHGFPATVFAISGMAGRSNVWDAPVRDRIPELPLLDWDGLGALAESGMTIGAHTRTHPRLREVPRAMLEEEIIGGADELEQRLGRRPTTFAYPFGSISDDAVAVVRRRFDLAVTTELRLLADREDPALVPRVDAYYLRAPGRLESWGSPAFRAHLSLRAAVRRVRAWMHPA